MDGRDLLEADALRAFAVFAEHRNFTAAAAALHISQPSLHTKIRKLGAAVGTELYQREGRRLRLTASGERLAAYARDARRRLDEFVDELGQASPTLTLAAGRGALLWVVAPAIGRISRSGRRLRVITADRDAAVSALGAGRADIAVVAYDPPPRHLHAVEIASYPQVLMVDETHALARRRRVRLADVVGLPLVVPPSGRPHRRTLERALLGTGVAWHVAAEVDGWDLQVHLTRLGVGAAIINGCVPAPAGVSAVPVSDLPRVRYWAACRRQRLSLVADVLEELRGRV
jgi:LysR family transcriptional regulator, low CO2-responsive transcriptional regulator